jgi:hypothetical protein
MSDIIQTSVNLQLDITKQLYFYNLNNIGKYSLETILRTTNENELEIILNSLKLSIKKWIYGNSNYRIIKYNKQYLSNDLIKSSGLFRSVIVDDNNKIVAFSPPKSMSPVSFQDIYDTANCVAEEFIEGTMINMFYHNGEWEIATKSSVGGKTYYFKQENNKDEESHDKITFRQMFLECCNAIDFDFDTCLNKKYCYSFVFQHPKNRIVSQIKTHKIYLIKVYTIYNYEIIDEDKREHYNKYLMNSHIELPNQFKFSSYEEIKEKYASMNTSYEIVGIMIYSRNGDRTKFRNPNYENVKKLRGNQPKLQYQYLCLRQSGQTSEFLKYYPEYKSNFYKFREQLHQFTNTLYKNYISCYIKKENPLNTFNYEYRNCMFVLHQQYLSELKPNDKYISRQVVIDYVNKLNTSHLMFLLNYNFRKNTIRLLNENLN